MRKPSNLFRKSNRLIIWGFVFVLTLSLVSFVMGIHMTAKRSQRTINKSLPGGNYSIVYHGITRSMLPKFFFYPSIKGRQRMGSQSAQITMIAYLNPMTKASRDFQSKILPLIKRDFIDKGVIAYYPKNLITKSDLTNNAKNVLYAAWLECAGETAPGKYWLFYNKIFKTLPNNASLLIKELNISPSSFDRCMGKESFNTINQDVYEVEEFGINIAPTVYIGIKGKANSIIRGTPSYSYIKRVIKFVETRIGE